MSVHVLLAGVSTRAAAGSAARAGCRVTAVDAFADLDQEAGVDARRVPQEWSPLAAVSVASRIECDAVAYLSNLENHPDAVSAMAAGRRLWGNSPEVLRRVRDPHRLAAALARHGLPSPRLGADSRDRCLVKPVASGGGCGIRIWNRRGPVPSGYYLQQFVDGISASIVFVANGREARVIGMTRQLAGLAAFGASGFQYCGNVLDHTLIMSAPFVRAAAAIASALTDEFRLIGLNGADVVIRDDMPYVVEVNPRWSASMELIERALRRPLFEMHAVACEDGRLPAGGFQFLPRMAYGKAIVYARHDVHAGDTTRWLGDPAVRDVPRRGTSIRKGQPVCTVFGDGADFTACVSALERRGAQVHSELTAWPGALTS